MTSKKKTTSYRSLQLLTGATYILMAILAFYYNATTLVGSLHIFGIISILKGLFEILNKKNIQNRTYHNQYSSFALGGMDVFIGFILLISTSLHLTEIAMIFGIWFISDAIISLFLLDLAKLISETYYYISLIVYLIGSLIGLILLIAGDTTIIPVSILIGVYLLSFGIIKFLGGIMNTKDLHVAH